MTPSDYAESLLLIVIAKELDRHWCKWNGTNISVMLCVIFFFLILAVLFHRKRSQAQKYNLEEEEDSAFPQ